MRTHKGLMEGDIVSSSLRTCSMRFAMSAEKIVSIVDSVAMTLVNAVLLAAVPLSAVLFVSHSI